LFRAVIRFLVYSNLFVAACASLMVIQTWRYFTNSAPDFNYIAFVFFATICSYSFHWWLTNFKNLHLVLLFIGIAGAGYFFYFLLDYWFYLLAAAFTTFLYSAPKIAHPWFRYLRKFALGKTIFLAFMWTLVTTMLPILFTGEAWTRPQILFVIHRFFMVYAICIIFDYRDREDDKSSGIKSLITYLNEKSINILFYCSSFIAIGTAAALLLTGFSPMLVLFLLVPVIVTMILFEPAKKNFSDILYYLALDGMMAVSALFMLVYSAFKYF
jgi:4-hydroxybenzoate polyprenyltransferase